jgi:hypothetical protein
MAAAHVCGPDCMVINRDFTMVCKCTGRCFGQYMSRNYHNGDAGEMIVRRPEGHGHKRQRPVLDMVKTSAQVHGIYCGLMWCAARTKLEGAEHASTSTAHHKKRRRLTRPPRDSLLEDAVCSAVSDVVKLVSLQKPFLKINTVTIGALYLMQHGKQFTTAKGRQWTIPQFAHLQQYLPSISDLPHFGYSRSLVRVGKNVIMAAARSS